MTDEFKRTVRSGDPRHTDPAPSPETTALPEGSTPSGKSSDGRWELHVLEGHAHGGRHVFLAEPRGVLVLGRGKEADIRFDARQDVGVSKRHARIVWNHASGEILVEDLGSTNGTRINGRSIHEPQRVGAGDVIELGRSDDGAEEGWASLMLVDTREGQSAPAPSTSRKEVPKTILSPHDMAPDAPPTVLEHVAPNWSPPVRADSSTSTPISEIWGRIKGRFSIIRERRLLRERIQHLELITDSLRKSAERATEGFGALVWRECRDDAPLGAGRDALLDLASREEALETQAKSNEAKYESELAEFSSVLDDIRLQQDQATKELEEAAMEAERRERDLAEASHALLSRVAASFDAMAEVVSCFPGSLDDVAAQDALDVVENHPDLILRLQSLTDLLREEAGEAGPSANRFREAEEARDKAREALFASEEKSRLLKERRRTVDDRISELNDRRERDNADIARSRAELDTPRRKAFGTLGREAAMSFDEKFTRLREWNETRAAIQEYEAHLEEIAVCRERLLSRDAQSSN